MARLTIVVLGILLSVAVASARASEADIKQAFQSKIPNATVESVKSTPFPGIYEVVFVLPNGPKIAYTDDKARFIFVHGDLYDLRSATPKNLTQGRQAELAQRVAAERAKLAAEMLPQSKELAIKRVRGNGKRVLYTFEDPNCGFCRKFQQELAKVNDITIYTFLWPILSPDSVEKSKAVWCAKDRGKAWDDIMTTGTVPQNDRSCSNPLKKNHELAQRFGVTGTPAVYLADGRQIGGYMAADKLEEALLSASSR